MTYQQTKQKDGSVNADVILRIGDNGDISVVPNDPANADWQDYQTWLAAGNTPGPAI